MTWLYYFAVALALCWLSAVLGFWYRGARKDVRPVSDPPRVQLVGWSSGGLKRQERARRARLGLVQR
ncbi:MAG TPA: hypothetical protein VFT22_01300 [Kofleriaceae bacterium]|nr:hypothetical protein [Kofleriaceae bacterium]